MDICTIGEIAIQGNRAGSQIQYCYIMTRMSSIVSQEKAVESTELHTHTRAHTPNSRALPLQLAAKVRHQRRQQLAPCTEKGREEVDGGYTESVRSNVRSLLSSSALWWAPFILADSNLYVKLTSLHRLCSDVLTGAAQLYWQLYSAITQLQGAGWSWGGGLHSQQCISILSPQWQSPHWVIDIQLYSIKYYASYFFCLIQKFRTCSFFIATLCLLLSLEPVYSPPGP